MRSDAKIRTRSIASAGYISMTAHWRRSSRLNKYRIRFERFERRRTLTILPQKEKEDLEEISNELELADEEEKIP